MSSEIRAITANVTCQVSGGEGHLSAEVDSRAWGLNQGKSQYYEGDSCYVLVYASKNVSIVGSFCAGGNGTAFSIPTNTVTARGGGSPKYIDVGFNVTRQALSFSNPVASLSRPPKKTPTILGATYSNCGDLQFIPLTTIAYLKEWDSQLDPRIVPPYAHVFIEYEPVALLGYFSHLGAPSINALETYTNTAVIFGVAQPLLI